MNLHFHKEFEKSYKKLSPKIKQKVDVVVAKFRSNPHDALLRNHRLKGDMFGRRAISVTGDVRIIFEEHDNYVMVVMVDVGTHPQVYGM